MRISVIITHYRHGRYLLEAVESVLSQTRPADEILVIDDATPAADSGWLDRLPEGVRLIRLPVNVGPGAARQAGVEHATGDWLAYLDADDAWEPHKLERQELFAKAHPEAAAIHTGMVVFSTDEGPVKTYVNKPARHLGRQSVLYGHGLPSSLMHRRDAVLMVGGWDRDRRLMDDWDMEIRMTNQCGPLWFVPEPLTRFRRANHGNLSSRTWSNIHKQMNTIWRHRDLTTSLHGRGVWRAVASRILVGEARKARGVTRPVVWALGQVVRLGAPALPPPEVH